MNFEKSSDGRRLMEKVEVDSQTSCWCWTAYKLPNGYGRFGFNGKTMLAHRVSFEIFRGQIPEGLFVCHHCDNRGCVNPDHLFLGTAADNVNDMMKKGRHVAIHFPGSTNPNVKISCDDVAEIRAAKGALQRDLAARFGISQAHVSRIRRGSQWKNGVEKA